MIFHRNYHINFGTISSPQNEHFLNTCLKTKDLDQASDNVIFVQNGGLGSDYGTIDYVIVTKSCVNID